MTTLAAPGAVEPRDVVAGGAAAPPAPVPAESRRRGDRSRRPPPVTRPIRPGGADEALALISSVLGMVGLVAVWVCLQVLVLGGVSQARSQELLYDRLRGELAAATAPVGPVVEPGAPVALLTIPRLGLRQVVVEGTASGDLLAGPGHRRDTVLPGQQGISVVYGRASTYGAPFARLEELRKGDRITADIGQGRTEFVVDGVRRAGDRLPQPLASGAARLTLLSGVGEGGLSSLRPAEVVYVDATAAKGYTAPAGRPGAVPDAERPMAGDPAALPMLALVLALLVGLTLAVAAARQRWRAALVWVIAAPVAIALAWLSTDVVVRLLPNLL